MHFAQRLQAAMEKKAITMYRLAKELNVHQTTVSNWINGRSEPKLDLLEAIAAALDVPLGELMGFEDLGGGVWGREASDDVYSKIAENIEEHHGKKAQLTAAFDKLNQEGREKAVESVEIIAGNPRYQKDKAPSDGHQ